MPPASAFDLFGLKLFEDQSEKDADAVIAHTGRPHGADTDAVLRDLGFSDERIAALRAGGDI